jgi:iron complex outermembrane receptor protein
MKPIVPPRLSPTVPGALLLLSLMTASLPAQTAPAPSAAATSKPAAAAVKPSEADAKMVEVMEAFTVTGSNIKRIDQETTLPVTVLTAEDLSLRGVSTAAELFDTLSIGGPIVLDEGNTLGADARGDNNSINLRGIGSGNTLILLNGRRLPPHPVSQAESGVPSLSANVNQLPAAAIGRVEVLRDGASAIYGTDAAAGVVNSITRNNFDGLTFRTRGMVTQHGGGNEWNFEVTDGRNFNAGKSNLLLTFDYYHRDMLGLWDREFSRNMDVRVGRNLPAPWNGLPVIDSTGATVIDNDFDNRLSSDSSLYGNYVRGSFDSTGTFIGARPTANRGIVTTSGSTTATTNTGASLGVFYLIPLADGTTGFRQSLPSHNIGDPTLGWFYNHNQNKVILPKSDRFNFTAKLRHRLDERVELFGEILAYQARSVTGRSPNGIDAATDHNIYVGVNNPYNPFGSRFFEVNGAPNADGTQRIAAAPADVLIASGTGVIPRDFKPRRIVVDSEAFRGVWGLKGKLSADWEWESAILYGRNKTHDEEHNAVRESRLRAALTSSDPAKAFNPFGYTFKVVSQASTTNPLLLQVDKPFTNNPAITESLYDTFIREGRTELASWDLRVNGSIFENFWGGPIGVAGGGEFRFENYKDYRPAYHGLNPASAPYNGNPNDPTNLYYGPLENDFVALSPNVNLYASRTVASVFSEVLVPIVGKRNRKPFVRSLELSIAGRSERYSDFGQTTKPKFGLSFRPNDWILVRGSTSGSFRAPNLVQTNTTPLQRSGDTYSDPYRYDVTALNIDNTAQPVIYRQGNASLRPESARSISAGIAVSAPFYRDLTVTFDYWRIQQRGVIDDVTATSQLLRDEELLDAAVQKALSSGTAIGSVNLGSGTSSYVGNPKVTRAGLTAADITAFNNWNATHPASQQRAPVGAVRSVVTDYVNLAGREVQGIDYGFELRLKKSERFGQFSIRGDGSSLLQFDTEDEPGAAKVDGINRDGRTRFRGNLGFNWRKGGLSAGWFTTYYSTYVDTGASTTKEVYDALGKPDYISVYADSGGVMRYRYLVTASVNHNAYVNYAIGRKRGSLFANTSIRFGINNVMDGEPPVADEDSGYRRGAATNPRGRSFYSQVTKTF